MSKEQNFYSKLRRTINDWVNNNKIQPDHVVDYILVVPDFFYLLWKLSIDKRIAKEERIKIGLLIIYFMSPLDLFPELIFGPIGFLDDLVVTAHLINSLMIDYRDIIFSHWNKVSNQDLLENIHKILAAIDNLIGRPLWNNLKRRFSF